MKILISNDDGYQAPGIIALYEALKDIAQVEVEVGRTVWQGLECVCQILPCLISMPPLDL